jgi:hypothetical protein
MKKWNSKLEKGKHKTKLYTINLSITIISVHTLWLKIAPIYIHQAKTAYLEKSEVDCETAYTNEQ